MRKLVQTSGKGICLVVSRLVFSIHHCVQIIQRVKPIKDGKVVETESQTSLKKAQTANKNGMDKEAFLQLS